MATSAVKVFEIIEGMNELWHYFIEVKFRGRVIERFTAPTKTMALDLFERAGYKRGRANSLGFDYES